MGWHLCPWRNHVHVILVTSGYLFLQLSIDHSMDVQSQVAGLVAKETGISSSRLDLWPMRTTLLLLNILNVILNLSKCQSQSHPLAVWSLRSEVCRSSSADCEVSSLSSAFWGLQVEFYSLRSTVWGLQSEVCRSSSAVSEHWGLQSEFCSL